MIADMPCANCLIRLYFLTGNEKMYFRLLDLCRGLLGCKIWIVTLEIKERKIVVNTKISRI